ncbi:hypothetical protein V2G26_005633 [Clonostachys chloroleuca]
MATGQGQALIAALRIPGPVCRAGGASKLPSRYTGTGTCVTDEGEPVAGSSGRLNGLLGLATSYHLLGASVGDATNSC